VTEIAQLCVSCQEQRTATFCSEKKNEKFFFEEKKIEMISFVLRNQTSPMSVRKKELNFSFSNFFQVV
jgi:hypothetical protein